MKGSDMVDLFFKHHGLKRVSGESLEPILPYFIGHVIMEIMTHNISPLKLKNEQRKWEMIWRNNYTRFNRAFMSSFDDDQREEVIDKMDEFEVYLQNHLMITKVAIMDCLPSDIPFEKQKVLADMLICNVLAQSATIVWGNVYKKKSVHKVYTDSHIFNIHKEESGNNPFMDAIVNASYRLMNQYHKSAVTVNCNKSPKVVAAVDSLCHKIIYYLVHELNKEKENA